MIRAFFIAVLLSTWIPMTSAWGQGRRPSNGAKEPQTRNLQITVKDGLVSMDVQDAEIGDVLAELARQSDVSLMIRPGLNRKISIRLSHLTFEEALRKLSQNTALVYKHDPTKNVYRIVGGATYSRSQKADKSADYHSSGITTHSTPPHLFCRQFKRNPSSR